MRKNKLIFIIILLLITTSIIYNLKEQPTTKPIFFETRKKIDKYKDISFYKNENKPRYTSYQEKNKSLKIKDIITQVNIGLDTPYYTNPKVSEKLNNELILINKYIFLPNNYIPNNLELINEKYSLPGMKLVNYAKDAFEKMSEAARKENLNIIAMSTYRSYNYQEKLYTKYVNEDGKEKADTYSARPGHSEHQTGLAVDVYNQKVSYTEFESTEEFKWLEKNAHKYGFILRYPKGKSKITGYVYEAWHYRYIGPETATKIKKQNITYDEYYIQNLDN